MFKRLICPMSLNKRATIDSFSFGFFVRHPKRKKKKIIKLLRTKYQGREHEFMNENKYFHSIIWPFHSVDK